MCQKRVKYALGRLYYPLNLIEGLKNSGFEPNRLIRKSLLRYFDLHNPEALIPVSVIYDFFEVVQNELGIESLATRFNDSFHLEKLGLYGIFLASSGKILPAILNSVANERASLSHGDVRLDIMENTCAYSVRYERLYSRGQEVLNNIELAAELHILKLCNEPDWSPAKVHFRSNDVSILDKEFPNFNGLIKTGQQHVGVVFETAILAKPLVTETNILESKVTSANFFNISPLLSGKIERLLDNWANGFLPSLNHLADFFGTSPATVKRTLAKEGLTYSCILKRWRFMKAVQLLTTTTLKTYEISETLCYANTSNFIKAFKSWTSLSPNEFR